VSVHNAAGTVIGISDRGGGTAPRYPGLAVAVVALGDRVLVPFAAADLDEEAGPGPPEVGDVVGVRVAGVDEGVREHGRYRFMSHEVAISRYLAARYGAGVPH